MNRKTYEVMKEVMKGIRKPIPPSTKVMISSDKKRYNRRDKKWQRDN